MSAYYVWQTGVARAFPNGFNMIAFVLYFMLIRNRDRDIEEIKENLISSLEDPSVRDEKAESMIDEGAWKLLQQLTQEKAFQLNQIRKNRWLQGPLACPEAVKEYFWDDLIKDESFSD